MATALPPDAPDPSASDLGAVAGTTQQNLSQPLQALLSISLEPTVVVTIQHPLSVLGASQAFVDEFGSVSDLAHALFAATPEAYKDLLRMLASPGKSMELYALGRFYDVTARAMNETTMVLRFTRTGVENEDADEPTAASSTPRRMCESIVGS